MSVFWVTDTIGAVDSAYMALIFLKTGHLLNGIIMENSTYSAELISSNKGDKSSLATLVVRFPRYILPEVNTHRVFSRNSASSRARSVYKTIESVMEDPFIPEFTINQKGMSGEAATGVRKYYAEEEWLLARDRSVESILRLLIGYQYDGDYTSIRTDWKYWVTEYQEHIYKEEKYKTNPTILNIHKQNVNRLIEPFMWHTAIITSSYWDNFFKLRRSNDAQPEIHKLADIMFEAVNVDNESSSPQHIPFYDQLEFQTIEDVIIASIRSVSECARISYKDPSSIKRPIDKDLALVQHLYNDKHMSPFEHQAFRKDWFYDNFPVVGNPDLSGNLSPEWVQLRHALDVDSFTEAFENVSAKIHSYKELAI
jgi:thymidylate synthase ThyX